MNKQLSIDFNPDIYGQHQTCREFIADDDVPRLCRDSRILKKTIAADMDYSPSQFANKLHGNEGARFTLDDLETYMQVTGSLEPIKYLLAKYVAKQTPEEIKRQIEQLQRQLEEAGGDHQETLLDQVKRFEAGA